MADPDELPALDLGDSSTSQLPELTGNAELPDLGDEAPGAAPAAAWQPEAPRVDYGLPKEILKVLLEVALGTDEPPALDPDWSHDELMAAAGFPPAPTNPVGALPYALQVRKRNGALSRELAQVRDQLALRVAEANGALLVLGDRCMDQRDDPTFQVLSELFVRVDEADNTTADRHDVHAMVEEDEAEEREATDRAVEQAESDAEPERLAQQLAADAVQQQEAKVKRAEAMLKRATIALRAAHNASAVTPERVAQLEQEQEAAQQQADLEGGKHRERKAVLDAAQAELDDKQAVIDMAVRARDKLREDQAQTRKDYNASLDEAHSERGDALCELGAQAVRRGLADKEAAAELMDALALLQAALRTLALTEASARSFDAGAVKQGMIVGALLVLAVVAILGSLVI